MFIETEDKGNLRLGKSKNQFAVVEATAGLLVGSVKVIIVRIRMFVFEAGVPSYFNINSIT